MEIEKDLIAASATPLVLSILLDGENYGYAIIKQVKELSGDEMAWTEGMLYPVLHRLERNGYIEARWKAADSGRKRKYYSLRPEGSFALQNLKQQWRLVDATLRRSWRNYEQDV